MIQKEGMLSQIGVPFLALLLGESHLVFIHHAGGNRELRRCRRGR